MTTVIDPAGTPTPVYNKSGETVVSIVGGFTATQGGSNGNSGTPIPRFSQTTIAIVDNSGSNYHIVATLPSDADVGDVVEVYEKVSTGIGLQIYPPVGESIRDLPASNGTSYGSQLGAISAILRKVSADNWQALANV
jgi:hypothetical protein